MRSARWLALVAIVCVYAPTLHGEYVWDDYLIFKQSDLLLHPERIFVADIFGNEGEGGSGIYRPLVMATYAVGQHVAPGPLVHKLLNIALALLGAWCVGTLLSTRFSQSVAWSLTVAWAAHPLSVEAVAWCTGRQDLLPAVLVVGAFLACTRRRYWLAALLLALAPWCKEPYMLVPFAAAAWMLAARRCIPVLVALPLTSVVCLLAWRWAVHMPLPEGADPALWLGSIGAGVVRLAEAAVTPWKADVLRMPVAMPMLGAASMCLMGAWVLLRGWRWTPMQMFAYTCMALALPSMVASAYYRMLPDRYFLLPLLGLVLVVPRVAALRVLAPIAAVLMVAAGSLRVRDWQDDRTLFASSLRSNPENGIANYLYGNQLEFGREGCAVALPYYERAMAANIPQASLHVLVCAVQLREWDRAKAVVPRAAREHAQNPMPAAYAVRLFVDADDVPAALHWAEEALRRDPYYPDNWMLLGKVRLLHGDTVGATNAFAQAVASDPSNREDALMYLAGERVLRRE